MNSQKAGGREEKGFAAKKRYEKIYHDGHEGKEESREQRAGGKQKIKRRVSYQMTFGIHPKIPFGEVNKMSMAG